FCMTLSPPTPSSDANKLAALQRLDQFREWRSVDDRRYCLVCGKIITGRQIQVAGGTRGNGPLQLSCPTERCNSIPMDWALPTNDLLPEARRVTPEKRDVTLRRAVDRDVERPPASQLRKLAAHLKQAL